MYVLQAQEDFVVQVEQGLLRGENTTSVTGFNYVMFLGVPYAEPPVGNLRFQVRQNSLEIIPFNQNH